MYSNSEYRDVEPRCYDADHIESVEKAIRKKFEEYFETFIFSEAGAVLTPEQIAALKKRFAVKDGGKKKSNGTDAYKRIIIESQEAFLKDQDDYIAIMDLESLEEYEDDASTFKSIVLRNKCPIIRKTLNSNRKELQKYHMDFNIASADNLLSVVTNICEFGENYYKAYDNETYENITSYQEMGLEPLGEDEYIAYGVIGGGIKSHLLYKVWPEVFPNRSREAIWALWYLSDKKAYGCKTDSEFLMVDMYKSITTQNYFYPYDLFSWYAFVIYKLLREKAEEKDLYIDPEFRYVIVDRFLSFVARQHESEIVMFQSQIPNGGLGYDGS